MKLFCLMVPCALFSRQRCRLPSKYMDMLTKSGINNDYNQRSVVWECKRPFCRNTMWTLVFPSPARTNTTQRHNTYKPLSITYSNFIPFKHRLVKPFLCCAINFLMCVVPLLRTVINTPIWMFLNCQSLAN